MVLQTQRTGDLTGGGKNIIVAYALWWFLGVLGVHRFYLDRPKSGVTQIVLLSFGWLPFFVGWMVLGIWWLLDAYFVYKYVTEYNLANGFSSLAVTLTTSKSVEGDLDYLEKLHSLREKGVLSEDEYQERRNFVMRSSAADRV